jgi:hypothetical protein
MRPMCEFLCQEAFMGSCCDIVSREAFMGSNR